MTKRVYLAGPITGFTFHGCNDWREEAIRILKPHGIHGINPLRAKHYLASLGELSGHGEEYAHLNVISSAPAVLQRDHWDATRCDVLLAHLAGAEKASIGTCMEIAWAHHKHIPIVATWDRGAHFHMMLAEAIGFKVATMDEALQTVIAILGDA